MSAARRRAAKLTILAVGVVALAAFAALPAVAKHGGSGDHPVGGLEHSATSTDPLVTTSTDPLVTFRRNSLFSCSGAVDGTATNNTANITATLTTVRAVVTVHAPPFTTFFGQLDQSNLAGACLKIRFFTVTVPLSGTAMATITDTRFPGSNGAFVWINSFATGFEITPKVIF
jgi:hypothetical protein